jgi:hypothetical protein
MDIATPGRGDGAVMALFVIQKVDRWSMEGKAPYLRRNSQTWPPLDVLLVLELGPEE